MINFKLPINDYSVKKFQKQTRRRKPIDYDIEVYVSLFLSGRKLVDFSDVAKEIIKLLIKSRFVEKKKYIYKLDIEHWKKERGGEERMEIEIIETE